MGRFSEAETHLKRAISLDAEQAESLFNLGNIYMQLNRFDDANNAYLRALTLRADHSGARRNLGENMLRAGRYQEAIVLWSEGLMLVGWLIIH